MVVQKQFSSVPAYEYGHQTNHNSNERRPLLFWTDPKSFVTSTLFFFFYSRTDGFCLLHHVFLPDKLSKPVSLTRQQTRYGALTLNFWLFDFLFGSLFSSNTLLHLAIKRFKHIFFEVRVRFHRWYFLLNVLSSNRTNTNTPCMRSW